MYYLASLCVVIVGTVLLVWQPQINEASDRFSYRKNWRGQVGGVLAYTMILGIIISLRLELGLAKLVEAPWTTGIFYVVASSIAFTGYMFLVQVVRRRFGRIDCAPRFYLF